MIIEASLPGATSAAHSNQLCLTFLCPYAPGSIRSPYNAATKYPSENLLSRESCYAAAMAKPS